MDYRYAREKWVSYESRSLEKMLLNLGDAPESSFVWFPKKTLKTEEGANLYYMEVPVGAQLYVGMSKQKGEIVKCEHVDNPANEKCVLCNRPTWYSDYRTALRYSRNNPKFVYAFEVTRPLRLVNFMDKRNLDIIHSKILQMIRTPGYVIPEAPIPGSPLPGEEAIIETQEQQIKRFLNDAARQMETLKQTTNYPIDVRDRFFDKRRWLLEPMETETAIREPNGIPVEQTDEFGDQKILSRWSFVYYDNLMVNMLMFYFKKYGIDGYYSPSYKSDRTHDSKTGEYYFPRELCIFTSKGILKHNKTSRYDGCIVQSGSSKTRRLHRKH